MVFSETAYLKREKDALIGFSNGRSRKAVEQELRVETQSLKWYKTKKGSFICEIFLDRIMVFFTYKYMLSCKSFQTNFMEKIIAVTKKASKVFVCLKP